MAKIIRFGIFMKIFLATLLSLIAQLFCIENSATGQVLPSFPGERTWGYEMSKVSNGVKSITETVKILSDEHDTLETSKIT